MEREQLTRLLKVRLTNEEAELLKEVSPQMEVRRFLQLGLMAVESGDDRQGLARLRIILNALQLSPYTTLQHHTDAHRSASITATFRSCFFSQAWLFKLYHLLEQRGLIGEAERIMGREAADRFLQLGERGPNNRSFLFGLGHAYAALSFPESPDSITWKDYATAVFNDWVESGDCYEPGYVAHNIAFVIELGEVLGKVQQLRSPQCKQIFERYLAHISPSGLAIAPGDGDDQSSYVKAMEIIYRLTGDTAFHWGVTMAQAAGQYGGYRDSREARVIDPECVLPTTTIPANGVTRIQYLFSGKAHVPDRILLNPSRQLGKPYMGMMINDRYETLHHISEDNRGEIYHYEVDGILGLKRSSWQKWAEQTNTLIARDPVCEYPFSYSMGLQRDHWYRASANIRLLSHFFPDERYVNQRVSCNMPHASATRIADAPYALPMPLEYVDQQSPLGVFLSNPRGFEGKNDCVTVHDVALSIYTLPQDYWTNSKYASFQRTMLWNRDEHRELVFSDTEPDMELRDFCFAGTIGTQPIEQLENLEAVLYHLDGSHEQLDEKRKQEYVHVETQNGTPVLCVHCPFGRLDLILPVPDLTIDLSKQYQRIEFDYCYRSDVHNYLRTPIRVSVNRFTCRSLLVDFQQGGVLTDCRAEQNNDDCYGQVDYEGIYSADMKWTRKTLLCKEGYLIVADILQPGKRSEGLAAGPIWQLRNPPERGLQWADAGLDAGKRLMVYCHPQRGHQYGVQYQPKIWVTGEYAFYDRAIVHADEPVYFLTVMLVHNECQSGREICCKYNPGGKLETSNCDRNISGIMLKSVESCEGINTYIDGANMRAHICSGENNLEAVLYEDGRWEVQRHEMEAKA